MPLRDRRMASFFATAIVLAVLLSCTDSAGPAGPPGEDGAQGEAGPEGPAGPAGPPGTANVIFSDWLPRPEVTDSVIDGNAHVRRTQLPAPELTDSIMLFGSVLVYFRLDQTVLQLPYTSYHPDHGPHTLSFLLEQPGSIVITQFTHDNSANVDIGTGVEFRYVLVPGGIPADVAGNLTDYQTLQAHFGLPD